MFGLSLGGRCGGAAEHAASTSTSMQFRIAIAVIVHFAAMGNSFGVLFRITTFGESHGPGLGVVVDGCPPRLALDVADVQAELDRRRPGQSRLVSQRKEDDRVEILSGVLDGLTLGTPIAMLIRNTDTRGKDYDAIARAYRPSHADYTYDAKYGIRAVAGGGRASARETAGRASPRARAPPILPRGGGVRRAGGGEGRGLPG